MLQNYLNKMNEAQEKQNYQEALDYALILEAELDPHFITNASEDYISLLVKICFLSEKLGKKELIIKYANKIIYYKDDDPRALLYLANNQKERAKRFIHLTKLKSVVQGFIDKGQIKENALYIFNYFYLFGKALSIYGAKNEGLKLILKARDFALSYDESLANADFYLALANAFSFCGEYDKAAGVLWQIYEKNKDNQEILKNLSSVLIRTGGGIKSLEFAWLCYEKRFFNMPPQDELIQNLANIHQNTLNAYEASGKNELFLEGKRVFLFPRQGLGDTIMFLRFLPQLSKVASEVLIYVQSPLERVFKSLFKENFSNVKYISGDKIKTTDYDHGFPFCTLPLFFAKDKIAKPLMLKEKYRAKKLQKIGIFWKTEEHRDAKWGDNGESRSFELSVLLEALKGYELYSFQVAPNEEEKTLFKEHNITDLGSEFKDFKDTFDDFGRIDFLICADTAIAHLALSAGVETAVLLPNVFDWRWGRYEEPKSPWYDDALLFACDYENDWHSAVKKLKKYLNSRI